MENLIQQLKSATSQAERTDLLRDKTRKDLEKICKRLGINHKAHAAALKISIIQKVTR